MSEAGHAIGAHQIGTGPACIGANHTRTGATNDARGDEGAKAAMGDSAEFEKLTELEARLATALDRIAAGQAAMAGGVAATPFDTGAADAAREEAEARASELSERVNMLEAQLAETQDALSETTEDLTRAKAERDEAMAMATTPAEMPEDSSDIEARLAEAEAARDAAQAELADKETELTARAAELEEKDAALAEAQAALIATSEPTAEATPESPPSEDDPDVEDMEKALAVMTRRVERARAERDEARKACDRAVDMAEELREAMGETPEERVLELRHQLRLMKTRAEDLAAQLAIVNSGADASEAEQGLVTELEALRQLRAADAAELDRIIADVEAGQAAAGAGGAHA
ncbi:hypothetical protein [Gymnodinialimonas hymeniacidonis]|uniref:hypothetical protein n=1 Tax=Gymnodinialimonas hymeniacidonis TaxID=3126508 RepID=UPI0034C6D612